MGSQAFNTCYTLHENTKTMKTFEDLGTKLGPTYVDRTVFSVSALLCCKLSVFGSYSARALNFRFHFALSASLGSKLPFRPTLGRPFVDTPALDLLFPKARFGFLLISCFGFFWKWRRKNRERWWQASLPKSLRDVSELKQVRPNTVTSHKRVKRRTRSGPSWKLPCSLDELIWRIDIPKKMAQICANALFSPSKFSSKVKVGRTFNKNESLTRSISSKRR